MENFHMLLWWSLLVVYSPKYPVYMKSFGLSGEDEVSLSFPVEGEVGQGHHTDPLRKLHMYLGSFEN